VARRFRCGQAESGPFVCRCQRVLAGVADECWQADVCERRGKKRSGDSEASSPWPGATLEARRDFGVILTPKMGSLPATQCFLPRSILASWPLHLVAFQGLASCAYRPGSRPAIRPFVFRCRSNQGAICAPEAVVVLVKDQAHTYSLSTKFVSVFMRLGRVPPALGVAPRTAR
jgi:hypothetical protein